MKKLSVIGAALLVLAGRLAAHEFFVIPDVVKDYRSGDTVQLNALSTHYFTVGEELEPPEVNEVFIVKNGAKAGGNLPLKANPDRLQYEASYRLTDDEPVIVVGNRIGGFYCLFTDGGYADGTRAEVEAANPNKTVGTSRFFAKYSKLYLNPDRRDSSFSKPLGHALEIIPLDNPAQYRKGARPGFRVLYQGQPLANAEVSATWDYFNYKVQNAFDQTTRTDAKGEVRFRFRESGLWLIRISDTRASSQRGVDEENLAAIAVFTVK